MLLLLACHTDDTAAPMCASVPDEGFEPVIEPDPRLDGDELWVAEDGASVSQDALDVTVEGPGGAALSALVDRGIEHTATATLSGEGAGRVELRHMLDSGKVELLASQDFDGDAEISLVGTPTKNGDLLSVAVVLITGGTVTLSGLEITGSRWAEVAWSPSSAAPVELGFLIHIEDDATLITDFAKWERRARVFAGLSQTLAAHGAALTIQPDINFVRASDGHDPGWMADRAAEGVAWSVHLHDESNGEEAFEAAARDARRGFSDLGLDVLDFNGGFALGMWDTLAAVGLQSVTAFKDAETQGGLPTPRVQPWRIADGATGDDLDTFTTHAPDGPLVYLPGDANREPDHARFPDYARRELSQVYGAAVPEAVNTWYFMFHVDGFSDGEADADEYLDGGGFEADLAYYDGFLSEVTDTLVADGAMRYGTPDSMRAAWDAWEADCASAKAE